jgi:hypothetical protein
MSQRPLHRTARCTLNQAAGNQPRVRAACHAPAERRPPLAKPSVAGGVVSKPSIADSIRVIAWR